MNNAEDQISDLEDRITVLNQNSRQKAKWKKIESTIRDLWDNIKWAILHIIGI